MTSETFVNLCDVAMLRHDALCSHLDDQKPVKKYREFYCVRQCIYEARVKMQIIWTTLIKTCKVEVLLNNE